MLLDSRNQPAYDLPPPDEPPQTYVVASTPRTGSTLLCRMLWSTGGVGAPKEYLNPTQIRDWQVRRGYRLLQPVRGPARVILRRWPWSEAGLRQYLHFVRHHRSSGGWFGLKIHHHHHAHIFQRRSLTDILGPIRWVRIQRADRLGQAISWARALQTGQWAAGESAWARPVYSRRLISHCLGQIEAGERYWDAFFARAGTPVVSVAYQDLTTRPRDVIEGVLAALGAPPGRDPQGGTMRPQADGVSAAWRARFMRWQRTCCSAPGGPSGLTR